MRLLYRGIPYEVPTNNLPTASSSENTAQPKVRLIYRGLTYEYEPKPVLSPIGLPDDAPTITLVYRGQTYQRKVPTARAYQPPRALNWRWQHQTP